MTNTTISKGSILSKIIKEAITESKQKYKAMNTEVEVAKLAVSKQKLDEDYASILEKEKVKGMIEKEIGYHEMRIRGYEADKEIASKDKWDDNLFLNAMIRIDKIQKEIDYHKDQLPVLNAELREIEKEINGLKATLYKNKETHNERVIKLEQAQETERQRILQQGQQGTVIRN